MNQGQKTIKKRGSYLQYGRTAPFADSLPVITVFPASSAVFDSSPPVISGVSGSHVKYAPVNGRSAVHGGTAFVNTFCLGHDFLLTLNLRFNGLPPDPEMSMKITGRWFSDKTEKTPYIKQMQR